MKDYINHRAHYTTGLKYKNSLGKGLLLILLGMIAGIVLGFDWGVIYEL